MKIQKMFAIGGSTIQLTFEPIQHAEDTIVNVIGYGNVYQMGQNELGGWEFMSSVPEELAMKEDDISGYLEDTLQL